MEEMIMRGRWPAGPEYVDKLEGSPQTKRRLRVILQTLTGELRVQQAMEMLDIGEVYFNQLRRRALQGALEAIEPRPAGRPSRTATPLARQIDALRRELEQTKLDLHVAQVREEIALIMPQVLEGATADPAKKTP
jgi:hypothetical protein